ncbi:MAG TPA: hypothetical protein VIT43_10945 [Candidatus Dormibacteraeota bacterium]
MGDGIDAEVASDKVVNIDSLRKRKPARRERRRFWEGLWRLWPERAYRGWDARPYDFDTYRELRERGKSTR